MSIDDREGFGLFQANSAIVESGEVNHKLFSEIVSAIKHHI